MVFFKIKKYLNVCFYCAILALDLIINLKIKRGKEPFFNAKEVVQQS